MINCIEQFEKKLFKRALELGFRDCEIYFIKNKTFQVKIFQGDIYQYKNADILGLSFRGNYNNKVVYSYTEKISEDIIDTLILTAKENAKITESRDENIFKYSENYPGYKKIISNNVMDNFTIEDKIDLAKNLEKFAYERSEFVKNVNNCIIGNNFIEIYLSNTRGIKLNENYYYVDAYISVIVEKDEEIKSDYEFFIDKNFKKFDPKIISKKAVDKALSKLTASSLELGKYDIILKNNIAVDFLSIFISNFYAESVQNGFSLLKSKINKIIASSNVTICDNISHEKSIRSTYFDSEGVPTQDKIIVENGVLKTYLFNLKSANRYNLISTGNGFKSNFKSTVGTSHLNFYIKEGNIDFSYLLKDLKNGLLITSLSGLHSGANVVSGDFSLPAEGFLIKDGKIITPVNQIMIAGNFYKLLKSIKNISNDLYFDIPSLGGSIGSPSILIKDIDISGKKE